MPPWWPDWPAYVWGAIPLAIFIVAALDRIERAQKAILDELRRAREDNDLQ